jgi:hypothetical protein
MGLPLQEENEPKVGDEIIHAFSPENERRYLAIRIGKDATKAGSELWYAWTPKDGTLCTVSVGYWWIVKPKTRRVECPSP